MNCFLEAIRIYNYNVEFYLLPHFDMWTQTQYYVHFEETCVFSVESNST